MKTTAERLSDVGIEAICERVANCETLKAIAESYGMSKGSLLAWIGSDKTRSDQYARAREAQAEQLVDDILAIADDSANDTTTDEDGNTVVNHEVVARAKLRVDSRKWLAGKMSPKKYGEFQRLEHSGTVDISAAILEARRRGAK